MKTPGKHTVVAQSLIITSKYITFQFGFEGSQNVFNKIIIFLPPELFMREAQPNPKNNPRQAGTKIVIDDRFLLRRLIAKKKAFNIYECVDLQASRLAIAYVKPSNIQFDFSKRIKEELRCKIAPALLWTGNFRLDKTTYKVQIHEKLGPSLKSMFSYVRDDISERDFLLLLYQLIKLVERFGSVGYVHRQLDLESIVFDPEPAKNELFLVNVFPMRKRGQEAPPLNSKYCSRAAHLGLKASVKDDLESICYILINIHTRGNFLRGLVNEEYSEAKANIDFSSFYRPLPPLFVDFYSYVISLNHSDEANFFRWRTTISKVIGRDTLSKPYAWMLAKDQDQNSESQGMDEDQGNIDGIELQEEIRPEDKRHLQKLHQGIIKFKKK